MTKCVLFNKSFHNTINIQKIILHLLYKKIKSFVSDEKSSLSSTFSILEINSRCWMLIAEIISDIPKIKHHQFLKVCFPIYSYFMYQSTGMVGMKIPIPLSLTT